MHTGIVMWKGCPCRADSRLVPSQSETLSQSNDISYGMGTSDHDEIIKWKHFPCYWPSVQGIHQAPVNSPHKGQWHGALMFSLICALNKQLSKQSWGWWFEMPLCSLWHHCNDNGMYPLHISYFMHREPPIRLKLPPWNCNICISVGCIYMVFAVWLVLNISLIKKC